MICAACSTPNEDGRKFCAECGASLAAPCPSCGTANAPGVKFCGECGTRLPRWTCRRPQALAPAREPAAAERRLVSVLFVDLVGFTAASEGRDSEDTRELLSRYFDVGPHRDRAVRRHGREVHRRRRDGGLGRADRSGGRCRARRSCSDRPRRRDSGDRSAAARPGRHSHGRGSGHARRDEPGHGCGRPRQHGLPDPVGCRRPAPSSQARRRSARPRRRSPTRTPASTS